MTSHNASRPATATQTGSNSRGAQPEAARLPMPVPLLLQLLRPINSEGDVDSLAAHLNCARARGCF